MSWASFYHLGDLTVTLPAASAILGWLLVARAWRAAFGWGLAFCLALGVVAATKIAFLGWETGIPALGYKALSGHATGFTAVFPTLCYLLAQRHGQAARRAAAGVGLALGAAVAAALVQAQEHTPAEAVAGWVIGACTFSIGLYLSGNIPAPPAGRALAGSLLACAVTALAIRSLPLGYWMVKLALTLSGNPHPFSWNRC